MTSCLRKESVAVLGSLEVELPVCPDPNCRRVGKIPGDIFGGKEYCVGLAGQSHKKVRMQKRTFRLVEEDEG